MQKLIYQSHGGSETLLHRNRSWVTETIATLFILLWVYAAVSKLLDYETFRIQLGKSPMLTSFHELVAWMVPTAELLIAGLLLYGKTRLTGLYASLFLMTLFTTYIITMLGFSSYIPCSCGGILEKLSWEAHVYFNLAFVLMVIAGILLEARSRNGKSIGTGNYQPRGG